MTLCSIGHINKYYLKKEKNNKIKIMNIPADLKYTEDHEWLRVDGDIAIVGITDYAQKELGDIVFVDVETVGDTLSKGDTLGTIEAVKTVADIFLPVDGEIIEKNEALEDTPELVNSDPYNEGWIVKVKFSDASQIEELLTPEQYSEKIGE